MLEKVQTIYITHFEDTSLSHPERYLKIVQECIREADYEGDWDYSYLSKESYDWLVSACGYNAITSCTKEEIIAELMKYQRGDDVDGALTDAGRILLRVYSFAFDDLLHENDIMPMTYHTPTRLDM